MRCFLAVDIPEDIKKKIYTATENFRKKTTGLKWVEKKNLHITVKFFGEIEDRKAMELASELEKDLKNSGSFQLRIKNLGTFPSPTRPRVLWFGVEDKEEKLREIWKRVERISRKYGLKSDKKEYVPHLTLARVKKPVKIEIEDTLSCFESRNFSVVSLTFYKSTLTPDGPIYTKIKEIKL